MLAERLLHALVCTRETLSSAPTARYQQCLAAMRCFAVPASFAEASACKQVVKLDVLKGGCCWPLLGGTTRCLSSLWRRLSASLEGIRCRERGLSSGVAGLRGDTTAASTREAIISRPVWWSGLHVLHSLVMFCKDARLQAFHPGQQTRHRVFDTGRCHDDVCFVPLDVPARGQSSARTCDASGASFLRFSLASERGHGL